MIQTILNTKAILNNMVHKLVLQPMYRFFQRVSRIGSSNYIYFWKSKALSDENITAPNTSDYSFIHN